MLTINKIAVFAHNKPFFGATLVQFPLYQHLRKNFPDAHIKIYSPVKEADLFLEYGLADEMEVYTKSAFSNYWLLPKLLKRYQPDLIINCREFSEQINIAIGVSKARFKIGFRPNSLTRFFYDKSVAYSAENYRGSNFLNLVYLLNLPQKFEFEEIRELGRRSQLMLNKSKVNVCLIPGGGEGEHKRWGIENFLGLCKQFLLLETNACFVFILGFKEEEYLEPIRQALPGDNVQILFKIKLPDMVKAIVDSTVVVANDCGPSHLAQMCKVNYISVWGWEKQQPHERIKEWFLPHPNAKYIVADEGKSIKSIKPERVLPDLLALTGKHFNA